MLVHIICLSQRSGTLHTHAPRHTHRERNTSGKPLLAAAAFSFNILENTVKVVQKPIGYSG